MKNIRSKTLDRLTIKAIAQSNQEKKDALDLLFEGSCDLGELPEIETALRSIAFLIQCAALRKVNNETVNSGFAGLVNVCADAVLNVIKRESIAF